MSKLPVEAQEFDETLDHADSLHDGFCPGQGGDAQRSWWKSLAAVPQSRTEQRPARVLALAEVRQSPFFGPALPPAFRHRFPGDATAPSIEGKNRSRAHRSFAKPGARYGRTPGSEPRPGGRLHRRFPSGRG